jgi:CYTH domain-containing protein
MSKYALVERERKFLISPDHVNTSGLPHKHIIDHYILNTAIRFRLVTDENGTTYKLTKKISLNTTGEQQITTIYLSREEYLLLNSFKCVAVEKTRYLMAAGPLVIGLDRYTNLSEELWIAEIEFATNVEMNNFQMPLTYLREVTSNPEFNGFELAKRFQKITKPLDLY